MLEREQERSAPKQIGKPAQFARKRNFLRFVFAFRFGFALELREQLIFVCDHYLCCNGDDDRLGSGNKKTCHDDTLQKESVIVFL